MKTLLRRRWPMISASVLTLVSLVLTGFAVFAQGTTSTTVDLNDGGVWVTNSNSLLVGRLNAQSQVLDGAAHTVSSSFDVLQQGATVLLHDQSAASVSVIDPAAVTLASPTSVPRDAQVALGGATVGILDASNGALWAPTADSLTTFRPAAPLAHLGAGAAMAVGSDGTVYGASRTGNAVAIPAAGSPRSLGRLPGISSDATLSETVVGSVPVVLDSTHHRLWIGSAGAKTVPAGAVLQQPSPGGGEVVYATATALVQQPLDGSTGTTTTIRGGAGVPAAPVVVGDCSYGAWSGAAWFVRHCGTANDDRSEAVPALAGSTPPVFRVNRTAVVLNDTVSGLVWLVDAGMKTVHDWASVTPQTNQTAQHTKTKTTPQSNSALPKRPKTNTPPVAVDDTFGIRAGRTALLPVLNNDTDADGDVLSAQLDGPQPSLGAVQSVLGGSELQITVPPGASGSGSFRYKVDDGSGGTATATVRLHLVPAGLNNPPKQLRVPTLTVEQGATVSYNSLPDWLDPDGDELFVKSATVSSADTVRSTASGLITFSAVGGTQGAHDIRLTVSDGIADTTGTIHVVVRPKGSVPPIINNDRASTAAGQPVTVQPLANDVDLSAAPLRLAMVGSTPGATIVPNYDAGTFTFQAARPGTYTVQYSASDGPQSGSGLVRIDVTGSTGAAPIAARDVALLPAGGSTLVDVLANDSDPAGGVLVVQSISVDGGLPIAVAILRHSVLRVTATAALAGPVSFQYTVANATASAVGRVTVVPVPTPAKALPPIANPDTARVRAGNVVTVDVLANDISPSGAVLHVLPKLANPLPPASAGTAFVSGDTVRFLAAAGSTGTATVTYQVVDSAGQTAAGVVTIQIEPASKSTNQPPRPPQLTDRVLAGQTVTIPVPLDGTDPDGDSVQLIGIAGAPSKGRIQAVGGASLTYFAYPGSSGTDTFTYRVRDPYGAEGIGTVRVGIAQPAGQTLPPTAMDDSVTVRPGRQVAVDVLANDSDPNGDTIRLDGLLPGGTAHASISGGRVLVTAPTSPGAVSVQYRIANTGGATAVGTLVVTAKNDAPLLAPLARDDAVPAASILGRSTIAVPVLQNDGDPDGITANLTVSVHTAGVSVHGGTVTVPITSVPQTILYTDTDVDGLTASAVIRVPGRAAGVPQLVAGTSPLQVVAGHTLTVPIARYVVAPSGKPVRITQADHVSATHAAGGSLVGGPATLVYRAALRYAGPDAITFEVTDGTGPDDPAGRKATLELPITVLPAGNQPPAFSGGSLSVAPLEAAVTLDLRALSTDPNPGDLAKLTYRIVGTVPAHLHATITGGSLAISADSGATSGSAAVLHLQVSDGTATTPGAVTVHVITSTRPLAVAVDDVVPDARQGQPVTVDVLANDANPFPTKPLHIVGVTVLSGQGSATVHGSQVVVTPGATFVGTLLAEYTVQDATNAVARQVSGRILVTVRGRPDAPGTPNVVSVADRTAVLSWAGGADNGAPITGYLVTSDQGTSQTCPTTTCSITGLSNGVDYRFTVRAVNAVGTSAPSPVSASVRPDTRPGAPTLTSIDYGDGTLTVKWTDGTDTGSALTGYTLELSPGGDTSIPAGTHQHTFTGLTNGAHYGVRIQAANKAPQPSDWSNSLADSPAGTPSQMNPPTAASAGSVGTQTQLTVSWTAPQTINAEALTGYLLRVEQGGAVLRTVTAAAGAQSANITVDNSQSGYTFQVAATNKSTDAGKTAVDWSAASASLRAVGKPSAPTITSATPGDNAIHLAWTASSGNGASASELSYYYDLNGDGVWRPAASTVTKDIANNNSYTVRMIARSTVNGSSVDSDPSAPSGAVQPYGQPGAPAVTATGNATSVSFSFSPPSPNGRPIDHLVHRTDGGGWQNASASGGSVTVGNGYSQGHSIDVYAVDSTGQQGPTASASASSGPAPAPSATLSQGPNGSCSSGFCPHYDVTVHNFVPGTYSYQCIADGSVWQSGTTRGVPADGLDELPCYNGYHQTHSARLYGNGIDVTTPGVYW